MFRTEFQETLPCGFLDEDGTLHREIVMRRATAADEILPLKDPRVVRNPGYLVIVLLSRVLTRLGSVEQITPNVIERLFATDLAYLQNLYCSINQLEDSENQVVCPNCQHEFKSQAADGGTDHLFQAHTTPGLHARAVLPSQPKGNGSGG
jgi:hypothetical protein